MKKQLSIKNKSVTKIDKGSIEKFEFELHDGEKIEATLVNIDNNFQVYICSQVGCGVGCQFCACSQEWLLRDLSWREIVAQVDMILENKTWHKLDLLFKGIGEPTNNGREVVKAIKYFLKKYESAKVIVTTTGADESYIKKFSTLPVSLELSLHAPSDSEREKIIATLMSIKKIVRAARNFAKNRKEKVTVNYLLLKDFNDSFPHMDKLAKLLDPKFFRMAFYHLNEVSLPGFSYKESDKFALMLEYMASKGFEVTEYTDIGRIASAGCGQLTST